MLSCHKCGTELVYDRPIVRSDECPKCRRDVRVCLNCRFYSPGSHYDCHETVEELVKDKDRATLCDFFRPSERGKNGKPAAKPGSEAARKLFGDD